MAIDRPSACVAHAPPSTTNITVSVKVSVLRCRANSWNSGRSSQRPATSTITSARTARTTMLASHPALSTSSSAAAIEVASASSGAKARSWNSTMPSASRACVRASSSWSPSWRITIAVEDIATAPPSTIATGSVAPSAQTAAPTTAVVMSTCSPPTPSTSDFIATMRASENSSPSVKTRNTTPMSASVRMASSLSSTPSACGPSTMPTSR
jgi:hypothetical protein